ncbi:MAG TPA: flagellar assembly protein FliH [Sediminispirochaeta sp.]|nr:flagellar assembly protein FliH [Sediminispirochaeta sp.]
MAKNVFRSQEVRKNDKWVVLQSPYEEEAEEVQIESVEEYTGPTADDLKREAEAFKQNWETEKQEMINQAKDEAERIIKEAERRAFEEVQKKTEEARQAKDQAEAEKDQILDDARREAEEMRRQAESEVEKIRKDAYQEGYKAGHQEGYESGRPEVERLVEQLHHIIDKTLEKRKEIIEESETQLINMVLLIAKKVVKVISENQKNVVINNVIQALRKLKSRGEVLIKVNLDDVELTTEHVKDFMRMVDNVQSVTVVEDSTVDKGGCIIETDFGEIDARISSQLQEIEEKITELAPIRTRGES